MLTELARHMEKLFYFYEVVHEGSIQATGRKLGVSAATLSYSLKELEAAAGVILLHRSKKGISPTAAGERLYEFCRRLYRDLEAVQHELEDTTKLRRKKIRIGTFSSIAIYFWPHLLEELDHDQLSISMTTKRSKEVLEDLLRKDVDIAITVGSFQHPHIVKHELYRDSFAYYESPESKRRQDTNSKFLFYFPDAEDEQGKSLKHFVHKSGLNFMEYFELDSFEVIAYFIKQGYGAGILPTRVAANSEAKLRNITPQLLKQKSFGEHCFYLSHRDDLELKQQDLKMIMLAASKAVLKLK